MEAMEQYDTDGGRERSPPVAFSTGPQAVRKRKADDDNIPSSTAPLPSSASRPVTYESKASTKRRKEKEKAKSLASPSKSSAAPVAPLASSSASTSAPAASTLAFAAVALAKAKRDNDKRKKKDSSAEDDHESRPVKEKGTEKESKEERRKRKEEKRARKAEKEKARHAGEDGDKEGKEKKKERKRKAKDGEDGEGTKQSKKNKRHASDAASEDSVDAESAVEVDELDDDTEHIAADFSQAVSDFMAKDTPLKKKKGKAPQAEDAAESEAPAVAVTPKSKKDKSDKRKGKAPSIPMPELLASPVPDCDPMDASGSEPEAPAAESGAPPPPKSPMSKNDNDNQQGRASASLEAEPPSSPVLGRDPMDASDSEPEPPSSPIPDRDPMDASDSEPEDDDTAETPAATTSKSTSRRATTKLAVNDKDAPKAVEAAAKPKKAAVAPKLKPKKAAAATDKPEKASTRKSKKSKEEVDAENDAEDEALRQRLMDDEGALHEYLASRWVDIPVLQRLEKKGILTWKRGKYTEAEREAVRNHMETFKTTHKMTDSEVVDIIFAKGRSSERSKYPGFWADVAAVVPGRPLRYVKEAVQRMYHPNAHKGAWTKEEDETLRRAYTETPGQWVRIGDAVGRSYTDCRDRYKKQIEGPNERVTGRWTKDEEKALTVAVRQAADELGRDVIDGEIPWPTVALLMGGKRTFHQCRVKWQESMIPVLRGGAYAAKSSDVLAALRKLGYEHEKDIVWRDVSVETNSHSKGAQQTWRRMLSAVSPTDGMSFKEILDVIDARQDELDAADDAKAAAAIEKAEKAAIKAADRRERKRSRTSKDHEPEWLAAAGALGEQALDSLATRGVSTGPDVARADKPRSRNVSFADDGKEKEKRKVSFADGGEKEKETESQTEHQTESQTEHQTESQTQTA